MRARKHRDGGSLRLLQMRSRARGHLPTRHSMLRNHDVTEIPTIGLGPGRGLRVALIT